MKRLLLDTHILVWLLKQDKHLNDAIRDEIEYFRRKCYTSVESLREIVILQTNGRLSFDIGIAAIIDLLDIYGIDILPTKVEHIFTLHNLPVVTAHGRTHDDPFDRLLISQAITEKMTMVSADAKFPVYRKHGLPLLENI